MSGRRIPVATRLSGRARRQSRAGYPLTREAPMTAIDSNLRMSLTGISGILVTPFDDRDRIAPARLRPIIDRALEAGVHILVANGNTGEFYGLTDVEAQ